MAEGEREAGEGLATAGQAGSPAGGATPALPKLGDADSGGDRAERETDSFRRRGLEHGAQDKQSGAAPRHGTSADGGTSVGQVGVSNEKTVSRAALDDGGSSTKTGSRSALHNGVNSVKTRNKVDNGVSSETKGNTPGLDKSVISITSDNKPTLDSTVSFRPVQPDPSANRHNGREAAAAQYQPMSQTVSRLVSLQDLLPHLDQAAFDLEDRSDVSLGSSASAPSFPLPPVPQDMAEAIKRQQKGAGSVRYWKTKHLQSGRAGHPVSLRGGNAGFGSSNNSADLPGVSAGFHHSLLPVLRSTSTGQGAPAGGGVTVNGSGLGRLNKARERMMRQKGRETVLGDLRRGFDNALSSSSNSSGGQYSHYHTHYMYGHSLNYPPPPPAYRRSVSTLESLLSLPALPSPSLPHPSNDSNLLTTDPSISLLNSVKLTQLPDPNPVLTLTHPPLHHNGSFPDPAEARPAAGRLAEDARSGSSTAVTDMTCLQLADAILSSKSPDFSRFYEICKTKIRYVDFLERSTSFCRSSDLTQHGGKGQPNNPRYIGPPRLHTWVPSLDLKDTALADNLAPPADVTPRNAVGGDVKMDSPRVPVSLPSLAGAGGGLKLSHGIPPSAGRGLLVSPLQDTAGSPSPPPPQVSSSPSVVPPLALAGKPILKPYNQDAAQVRLPRHHDPFSPRTIYTHLAGGHEEGGPLSVRGTTMYPLGSEDGRVEGSRHGSRRTQSSAASRKEAELRKRAVRFSISDQVYEFAPGEPVKP